MILKVNDTKNFNVSLKLTIDCDLEYLGLIVCSQDKKMHTTLTKQFPAEDFPQALAYYKQQEDFLLGNKSVKENER